MRRDKTRLNVHVAFADLEADMGVAPPPLFSEPPPPPIAQDVIYGYVAFPDRMKENFSRRRLQSPPPPSPLCKF